MNFIANSIISTLKSSEASAELKALLLFKESGGWIGCKEFINCMHYHFKRSLIIRLVVCCSSMGQNGLSLLTESQHYSRPPSFNVNRPCSFLFKQGKNIYTYLNQLTHTVTIPATNILQLKVPMSLATYGNKSVK